MRYELTKELNNMHVFDMSYQSSYFDSRTRCINEQDKEIALIGVYYNELGGLEKFLKLLEF
jgi:hypothetical protein